jgi:hyaluronoglucosaminidase
MTPGVPDTGFAVRGVIEGFYGRLWTWPERERVADIVGEAGFTTYAYAPKEDRFQNAGWREAYPADVLRRMRRLADRSAALGMELWLGLRPVGISYADPVDVATVADKLARYLDAGAARLVLLADDIPGTLEAASAGRFTQLADAHLFLIDDVLRRLDLDAGRLVFVPTDYHGPGTPYLERLGASVPAEVDVCWTGTDVFVPGIEASEAERIGAVLQRPPLVWDNYPVNDEPERHDLRLGPIRGRAPQLTRRTRGFLVNPALEPEATLVPLLTWAEYLADPVGYDPDGAWRRALVRVTGSDADADLVATLAAGLDRSIIDQRWERPPAAQVKRARAGLATLRNQALADDLAAF